MTAPTSGPSTISPDRLARVALSIAAEPGDLVFNGLVNELGACELVHALTENPDHSDLLSVVAGRLRDLDPVVELERAHRQGIRFVTPEDAEWPRPLNALAHAGAISDRGGVPIGLWVRGPLRLNQLDSAVAIVGARSASTYGAQVAADLAAQLGHAGRSVVSGAAFGIDYAAHRGALSANAATVAVLACGVDTAYPSDHRPLLTHLAEHHAVVSEAPPGAAPHRVRFLARNRLIAGFCLGTVVVEAAIRSGSLNTLHWAQRLNRIAMGVPGPVTQATSEGIHHQIRSGGAQLVTNGRDILELVGKAGQHLIEEPRGPEHPRDKLSTRQRQVLDAVPVARAAGPDSIAIVAGRGLREVYRTLLVLGEQGLVEQVHGGWRLSAAGRS